MTLPATLTVSGVAAIVNGQKITNEQLVREFIANGGQPTLQQLIVQTELEQAAKKAHVTVTEAEIDQRLHATKMQVLTRSPGQSWSQFLASRGLSEQYARTQTRLELLLEKLALAGQPAFNLNGKIHIYHLLIATTALPGGTRPPHSDADAHKLASQILADIRAHKMTFQEAARKYSDDYSNASKGGDLGWVSQSDPLDPAFKTAAFQLREGQISEPVKTQYGWHLIYASQFGSHASPADVHSLAQQTQQERAQPFVQQYVQQLTRSSHVQDILVPTPSMPSASASPQAPVIRPGRPIPLPNRAGQSGNVPPPPPL